MGLGLDSVRIEHQLTGRVFSSIFSGSALVALGESSGTMNPLQQRQSTLVPQIELGYSHFFSDGKWFLGGKVLYQYLNLTMIERNLESFPKGTYLAVNAADTWVGRFRIESFHTEVNQQLSFPLKIGISFDPGFFYLGVGATVFQTKETFYGVRGDSRLNGAFSDSVGSSVTFSSPKWVWGGMVEFGWLYSLGSFWFLDVGYQYAMTGNTFVQNAALFSGSLVTGARYTEEGIVSLKSKQRITAQSAMITLKKVF